MDANTPLAGINDGYCVGPSSYSTRILGETQNLSDKNEWLHSSVLVLRVVMLLKVCLQLNLKVYVDDLQIHVLEKNNTIS